MSRKVRPDKRTRMLLLEASNARKDLLQAVRLENRGFIPESKVFFGTSTKSLAGGYDLRSFAKRASVIRLKDKMDRADKHHPKSFNKPSILKDMDLYKVKLDVTGGEAQECKIRVGTTPARGLMVFDKETGEDKFIRIPEKPKYQNVGTTGIIPKDGGR